MACGCPVIASRVGCSPKVTGDAALLVDPCDVEAIGNAIRNLLTDEKLTRELIERGLRRCRHFSWAKCARETLAVFQRVKDTADETPRSPRAVAAETSNIGSIRGPLSYDIPLARTIVGTTSKDYSH